jgi:hypothetical protein
LSLEKPPSGGFLLGISTQQTALPIEIARLPAVDEQQPYNFATPRIPIFL